MGDLDTYSPAIKKLVLELTKFPTIGRKTAQRLAYFLVKRNREENEALIRALTEAKERVKFCQQCFFVTEEDICLICKNPKRDQRYLCVVEKPVDVVAIEKGGEYNGYYHVLHGLWAPLRGIGPEQMKIEELKKRLSQGKVEEVIIATGTTVEGDATALYIAGLVKDFGIKCSRLAQGIPKGGEIEYADEATVSYAFKGRREI